MKYAVADTVTLCALNDNDSVHVFDNHVTVLPHANHEKKIQETPI